jgi:protein-S-isoprenylcysteine O-methyltransferase Ste14
LLFLGTFAYAIGFVGNILVPKSIDSGPLSPLLPSLVIDLTLLAIFAFQHSVMARPWFKALWTRIVPTTVERSTYVLLSSAALLLLFWKWQPIGGVIWNLPNASARIILEAVCAAGWLTVLASTVYINHLDLFGVRQVWLLLRGRPYTPLTFDTPGPYKFVRHPLYVGFLLAFWATPVMTSAHLVFALRYHRLHSQRDSIRRTRSCADPQGVCRIPPRGTDAPAHRRAKVREEQPAAHCCFEARELTLP